MANSQMKNVKKSAAETWHCTACGERVMPFEKSPAVGVIEGLSFVIGIICVFGGLLGSKEALAVGLILIIVGGAFSMFRTSKKAKVCPVCESPNIIPSTSPNAKVAVR